MTMSVYWMTTVISIILISCQLPLIPQVLCQPSARQSKYALHSDSPMNVGVAKRNSQRGPFKILIPLPEIEYPYPVSLYNPYNTTSPKVRPVIDLVIQDVIKVRKLLNEGDFEVRFVDTEQSDIWGPIRVIEAYWSDNVVDCILGFVNIYGLVSISRYSHAWPPGIPVITTTGLSPSLAQKHQYRLLTRVSTPYDNLGHLLERFLISFNYTHSFAMIANAPNKVLQQDSTKGVTLPHSECQFKLDAFKSAVETSNRFKFDAAIHRMIMWFNEHEHGALNYYSEILKRASFLGNGWSMSKSALGSPNLDRF